MPEAAHQVNHSIKKGRKQNLGELNHSHIAIRCSLYQLSTTSDKRFQYSAYLPLKKNSLKVHRLLKGWKGPCFFKEIFIYKENMFIILLKRIMCTVFRAVCLFSISHDADWFSMYFYAKTTKLEGVQVNIFCQKEWLNCLAFMVLGSNVRGS